MFWKRLKRKIRKNFCYYLRCGAKITTFVFWATLYLLVMKMTVFKNNDNSQVVRNWALAPDNYSKWLMQGPVLGEDEPELDSRNTEWQEPDNDTLLELEARAKMLHNVCLSRRLPTDYINSKEFFVDHQHNIVWCNIFKAASSSWMYRFNILGGYTNKYLSRTVQTPLMLARQKFPRPTEEELRDAVNTPGVISLIVVREPFVRLLSAYRDKLENITPPYYRKLARSIVQKYRESSTKIFGPNKSFGPTFYEFISYLIDQHKNGSLKFDEHWAPYYQFCTPCAVNFTVISKVETLRRDTKYVVQQLGLGHVLERKVEDRRTRLRTVMNKSRDGKNTTSLIKRYYSQLDEQMLNDLLQIYGIDFEMFGYDPKVYRRYIRK